MELKLEQVGKQVGASTHLYPLDLTLVPRAVTVLLGATQAGKTSLMRLMAGLDKPTQGRVLADGTDVTGVPVRERNVAMVYQQFINYPSMSVAANIASPLRLRGALDRPGLADAVVDLVQTGGTLRANNLEERDVILHSSARLVVNRAAMKLRRDRLRPLIERLREVVQEGGADS